MSRACSKLPCIVCLCSLIRILRSSSSIKCILSISKQIFKNESSNQIDRAESQHGTYITSPRSSSSPRATVQERVAALPRAGSRRQRTGGCRWRSSGSNNALLTLVVPRARQTSARCRARSAARSRQRGWRQRMRSGRLGEWERSLQCAWAAASGWFFSSLGWSTNDARRACCTRL